MRTTLEFLFWLSVFLLVYPYVFYPSIIWLIGLVRPRPVRSGSFEPTVTVLIPAYNEADCIGDTVQNKLSLAYPREKLRIIVVSDGSDDGTDEIVRGFAADGVELQRQEGREGKAAALNAAMLTVQSEIVVFSDANSLFERSALKAIVSNFADAEVGYVTGSLSLVSEVKPGVSESGGGAYLRFENALRVAETKVGSIIGVNGGIDAIRTQLYSAVPKNLITDFVLPLTVIARGSRVVYEPGARSREVANSKVAAEFRMRVRVALRALQGLSYMKSLLNPIENPLVAFCLWSHKLIRYFAFVFLITAFLSSAILAFGSSLFQMLFALQVVGYIMALLDLKVGLPSPIARVFNSVSYLLLTYLAFAIAAFRFLRGDSMATWRPREG